MFLHFYVHFSKYHLVSYLNNSISVVKYFQKERGFMMNPIIQSLYDRKSCRIFEDKEISQKERQLILEACMQAPSAGNQQMYTIIDVQDQKQQETLSKT